jgi:hypothetical protein
MENLRRKDSRK